MLSLLLLSLLLPRCCFGVRLFTSPEDLPTKEYDFVIAGGGTAGCVLASRLSANPDVSVLLIEAGGDHRELFGSIVPFLAASLVKSQADWNHTTTPQAGFANRSIWFERGHVLGGSSTVNYMVYNRGSNDFYDSWAKAGGDDRWSWKSLEAYFQRNHQLVPPIDNHDYGDRVFASAHGDGPVEVSTDNYPLPLDELVLQASKEMGSRFRSNSDINAGDSLGTTYTQLSLGRGKRSSAATAFLDPLFSSKRSNLDILINTHVTKMIQTGTTSLDRPVFRAVEITKPKREQGHTPNDESTSRTMTADDLHIIHAKKEVILSTGVVGTPKILQLSGIGPKDTLADLGITPVINIPDVGKNLTDHPMSILYFSTKTPNVVDAVIRSPALFGQHLQEWQETSKGLMAAGAGPTQNYMRLPATSPILQGIKDPSSGPHSGHTELLFGSGFIPFTDIPLPEDGNFMFALAVLVSPTSRGAIQLTSSDPFDPPLIDPNYLATDFDKGAIVQAMRDTCAFLEHETFREYVEGPYGPLANLKTDEELLAYTQNHGITINHGTGTAKMAPFGADWGVVGPDLKVRGVEGVRIVDASVFTEIPEVHTMAPVYIVAERAADMILDEYGLLKEKVRDEL